MEPALTKVRSERFANWVDVGFFRFVSKDKDCFVNICEDFVLDYSFDLRSEMISI